MADLKSRITTLSTAAAVQICSHPDLAVLVGGSEDKRKAVDMIEAIIDDIMDIGLGGLIPALTVDPVTVNFCFICGKLRGQPPDRCPGHYDTEIKSGLDPLDIQCVCGHRFRDHFQDGNCNECRCKKFDSGYTDADEVVHA